MNKKKIQVAEGLIENLQQYVGDVESGDHDPFYDDYTVDSLCDMQEVIQDDGEVDEGRRYQGCMLVTDKPIKIYEIVEVERELSGTNDLLKVMFIRNVQLSKDGKLLIEFLGEKVEGKQNDN